MLKQKCRRGQSVVEYIILLMLVMSSFLAMSAYLKRGMQGRWQQVTDGLGDQYDPRFSDGTESHRILTNAFTNLYSIETSDGDMWTKKTDQVNTTVSDKTELNVFTVQ